MSAPAPRWGGRHVARILPLLAAVVMLACTDPPAGPPDTGDVLAVVVNPTPSPFVREVLVTLARPAPATVTWGAPTATILTMTADSASTTHRFLIPRLRAARDYTVDVRIPGDAAGPFRVGFSTDALLPAYAAAALTETGTPSLPLALVEVVGATGVSGLLVVEHGEIVGNLPMAGSLFGMARRANGEFVLLDAALGLTAYTIDGTLVRQLPQATAATPYRRIHHDAIATPQNTVLFIADDTATITDTLVTGESLWEWAPESGTVTKRFSVFDHLDWKVFRGPRSVPGNWLHGNGINYGPRGNVLMSFRNADYVISIAPDWSAVEWTLGGPAGTLALDPAERFFGQHFVSEPSPGRVLIFDNGFDRPGGAYSRAVEYEVNVGGGTATKVWDYRHAPDIYAALVGSTRRLANGNTVTLFGMLAGHNGSSGPITAVETTPGGTVVWRLGFNAAYTRIYRVNMVSSLIGEVPGSFVAP